MNDYEEQVKLAALSELAALIKASSEIKRFVQGKVLIDPGTRIYDLNGEELLLRFPLSGEYSNGYIDVALSQSLGSPLFAITESGRLSWDEPHITEEARRAGRPWGVLDTDEVRFVFFDYPKVGVQFRRGDVEIIMIEVVTWEPVRDVDRNERGDIIFVHRASFLESLPERAKYENQVMFYLRTRNISRPGRIDQLGRRFREDGFTVGWLGYADESVIVTDVEEKHLSYSKKKPRHRCFELRGQITRFWCVPACVEMVLDFYRYEFKQDFLAEELGLGTIAMPVGLLCFAHFEVTAVMEKITGGALESKMNACSFSFWPIFQAEIGSNRPMIVFSGSHSRVLAGYLKFFMEVQSIPMEGSIFYDPWPPNEGVITYWEAFSPFMYSTAFSARLIKSI